MKRLLINCYYDGMTLGEAISFIKRCYQTSPSAKHIADAKQSIKDCTGVDWK